MTTTVPDVLALPNGWHLVTYGAEQISIAPDGLLMFPRHLTPDQVPDYIGALKSAAEIATKIREDNAKAAKANTSQGLPTRKAIVTAGPPPPGATRLQSAIGRPKRRERRP